MTSSVKISWGVVSLSLVFAAVFFCVELGLSLLSGYHTPLALLAVVGAYCAASALILGVVSSCLHLFLSKTVPSRCSRSGCLLAVALSFWGTFLGMCVKEWHASQLTTGVVFFCLHGLVAFGLLFLLFSRIADGMGRRDAAGIFALSVTALLLGTYLWSLNSSQPSSVLPTLLAGVSGFCLYVVLFWTASLGATLLWILPSPGRMRLKGQRGTVVAIAVRGAPILLLAFLVSRSLPPWSVSPADKGRDVTRAKGGHLGDRPNVVLIVMDAVRADHLPLHGYSRNTMPRLTEFAKEGVAYVNCLSTAPSSVASHASLFTGLYPSRHGAHKPFPWDAKGGYHVYPLDTRHATLAELLSQEGYQTCGISANPIVNRYYGLDQGFGYYSSRKDVIYTFGFVRFFWHLNRVERVSFLPWADTIVPHVPPPYRRAEDINREVIEWLEEHGDTPFFLFVNYLDAHKPYLPKPPYHLRWPGLNKEWIRYDTLRVAATRDIYNRKRSITPSERNHLVALYDGELSYLDDQLGILFDYMRGRGLLDNTLVVVTSDHGESLGDHYNLEHEFNLYQELIHVPLVVRYPSSVHIEAGGVVRSPVQTVDIVSTVLALLNIPSAEEAQGKTLFQRRDYQFAEKFMDFLYGLKAFERVSRCVVQMPYKYIWHSDGTEELYRLDQDPLETTNVVYSHGEMADFFRRRLSVFQEESKPRFAVARGPREDEATRESLKALGYIREN